MHLESPNFNHDSNRSFQLANKRRSSPDNVSGFLRISVADSSPCDVELDAFAKACGLTCCQSCVVCCLSQTRDALKQLLSFHAARLALRCQHHEDLHLPPFHHSAQVASAHVFAFDLVLQPCHALFSCLPAWLQLMSENAGRPQEAKNQQRDQRPPALDGDAPKAHNLEAVEVHDV